MTVHERPVGATVEWFTPPELFEALGLTFDLDPAAPELPAADWVPARRRFTERGEQKPWTGQVWLNPPSHASVLMAWGPVCGSALIRADLGWTPMPLAMFTEQWWAAA